MKYFILAFVLTVLSIHITQAQSVADSSGESIPKGETLVGLCLDASTRDVSSINYKLTEKGYPTLSNFNLPYMSVHLTIDYYNFIYQLKLPLHILHNPDLDKYGYSGGSVGSYSSYQTFLISEIGYSFSVYDNYLSLQPGIQFTFGREEFGVARTSYTSSGQEFHQTSTRLDFPIAPTLNLNYHIFEKSKKHRGEVDKSYINLHIGYNLWSLIGTNKWYSPDWFTDSVPWLSTDDLKQRGLTFGITAGVYM